MSDQPKAGIPGIVYVIFGGMAVCFVGAMATLLFIVSQTMDSGGIKPAPNPGGGGGHSAPASTKHAPMQSHGSTSHGSPGSGHHAKPTAPAGALVLNFTYGSEKKKWIREMTAAWNSARHTTGSGKVIWVEEIAMGSGESMDEILTGRRETHLVSPASSAFIELGNAESQARHGTVIVEDTESLVASPVVIAMWKPMAEAIGWGKRPLGWSDIIDLARNENGWAAHGHGEWGSFKFGHTHPEFSNSGLISLLAEVYAGAGKTRGLSLEDVGKPGTAQYLRSIELAVVHYGSSTGFFGRKMFKNGPNYLSAAVLYENMVIESYNHEPPTSLPVVAIYPKEGTFWSDHPVGVVERPYVTDEHREAAEAYIEYLLKPAQQTKALVYGFRPGNLDVPVGTPVDVAHGVDPDEPKTTLEVPPADVMKSVINLWKKNKKHANIVLVLDTSGSMQNENRMPNAKKGAEALLDLLGDEDILSLIAFSSNVNWLDVGIKMGDGGREQVRQRIRGLFPRGRTALYDATWDAFNRLQMNKKEDMISAVVVLTDGADQGSRLQFQQLLERIQGDNETKTTRVFTIGYGSGAQKEKLEGIADATEAKFYHGKPENIREVFKQISTFF